MLRSHGQERRGKLGVRIWHAEEYRVGPLEAGACVSSKLRKGLEAERR
jgi:hypothetical protein